MIAILDRNLNVTGRIMPEKQPLNLPSAGSEFRRVAAG